MKNDTMKLLESIQNNLNKKSLKEGDLLNRYTAEEYDEYDGKIRARTDIFMEEDAEELGISVDEAIDRLVKGSGVTLESKKPGAMNGATEVTVLGYSDQIAKFFSGAGLYDGVSGYDTLYDLVVKDGFEDIELSKIDDEDASPEAEEDTSGETEEDIFIKQCQESGQFNDDQMSEIKLRF